MKVVKFKCSLLSDVILNRKSATDGPNETLDFIPGSNFLGIVAGQVYSKKDEINSALRLFHSGEVRFGDAHPSIEGIRGHKVPASMFYPKLKKADEELYIHHAIPDEKVDDMRLLQLKQCRAGFYTFHVDKDRHVGAKVDTTTNYAIKSAYDRVLRKSKDQQMFGYESLQKGLLLYFSVEVDNDSDADCICRCLVGIRRIGRSRTAQYGLVNIEKVTEYDEVESKISDDDLVTVYADSRLILLDKYGMPTFRPEASQLGVEGEIVWDKSQIRTFRYAPWNFVRQCFDTDRCGIEKGSVFVIKLAGGQKSPSKSVYVGVYNNEGFGRVIYNPSFLDADKSGSATFKLVSGKNRSEVKCVDDNTRSEVKRIDADTPLLKYLKRKDGEQSVYMKVNKWVKVNAPIFSGDAFASQWGNIRTIAKRAAGYKELKSALFDDPDGYLVHGVAKDKWESHDRLKKFQEFVDDLDPESACPMVMNLASEMAKKSKKNGNNG